eukprot:TRINITY_DN4162_c0_g1_i6.p1 TRINITY_DN4162_c0_g1~~TRINITY_DN4162_c0_g1_i6.p1  ORF type:complete len:305 (-),score=34.63 TRINITY_DN4162_c0_g1_i6:243-1073(-)
MDQIMFLLDLAENIKAYPDKYYDAMRRKTLLMFFAKPSLRTRISLEVGMSQLGGHAIYYQLSDELQGKKESLADTARVVSRFVDVVMARVQSRAEIMELAKYAEVPVINGLDDFAHPLQILSDLFTIKEKKNITTLEGWKSLKFAYCGDCRNNVTYDWMRCASVLGFSCNVAGPKGHHYDVEPEVIEECKILCKASGGKITIYHDAVEAVKDVDIIYTDSWMSYGIVDATKEERVKVFKPFQVTDELLSNAKKRCSIYELLTCNERNGANSKCYGR